MLRAECVDCKKSVVTFKKKDPVSKEGAEEEKQESKDGKPAESS
jgi:hypothetical protein